MPTTAVFLIVFASALHVLWNGLLKASPQGRPLGAALVSVGLLGVLLALAMGERVPPTGWIWILATGGLHTLYFGGLSFAYRKGDLSQAYPLARGVGVALLPLVVLAFLGVPPQGWVLAGIGLVAAGSVWGAVGDAKEAVWPALFVGLVITFYSFVDKEGVTRTAPFLYMSLASVVAGSFLATITPGSVTRSAFLSAATVVALATFTYIVILYAYRTTAVAPAFALRQTGVIWALLWGLSRKEKVTATRWGATLLILLGTVLVALG